MKTMLTIMLLTATLALSACNTIEGIGQDAAAAGRAIRDAASSNKGY